MKDYNTQEYDAMPIATDIKMVMNNYFVKTREQMPGKAAVETTRLLNNVYKALSDHYQNIMSKSIDGKIDSQIVVDEFRKLKLDLKISLCGDIVDVAVGMKE